MRALRVFHASCLLLCASCQLPMERHATVESGHPALQVLCNALDSFEDIPDRNCIQMTSRNGFILIKTKLHIDNPFFSEKAIGKTEILFTRDPLVRERFRINQSFNPQKEITTGISSETHYARIGWVFPSLFLRKALEDDIANDEYWMLRKPIADYRRNLPEDEFRMDISYNGNHRTFQISISTTGEPNDERMPPIAYETMSWIPSFSVDPYFCSGSRFIEISAIPPLVEMFHLSTWTNGTSSCEAWCRTGIFPAKTKGCE